MEIIPGINEVDFEEARRKFEMARGFGAEWVEIDIGDGKFGTVATWRDPERLRELLPPPKVAAHLMLENPDEEAVEWMREPVKRLIWQVEAARDSVGLARRCRERGIEPGLSIMAATPWEKAAGLAPEFNFWQVLAVTPGRAGQKFDERALKVIRRLRQAAPDAIIEVDGGVNKEVAKKCKEAGADIVAAASYIYNSKDAGEAIKELQAV